MRAQPFPLVAGRVGRPPVRALKLHRCCCLHPRRRSRRLRRCLRVAAPRGREQQQAAAPAPSAGGAQRCCRGAVCSPRHPWTLPQCPSHCRRCCGSRCARACARPRRARLAPLPRVRGPLPRRRRSDAGGCGCRGWRSSWPGQPPAAERRRGGRGGRLCLRGVRRRRAPHPLRGRLRPGVPPRLRRPAAGPPPPRRRRGAVALPQLQVRRLERAACGSGIARDCPPPLLPSAASAATCARSASRAARCPTCASQQGASAVAARLARPPCPPRTSSSAPSLAAAASTMPHALRRTP